MSNSRSLYYGRGVDDHSPRHFDIFVEADFSEYAMAFELLYIFGLLHGLTSLLLGSGQRRAWACGRLPMVLL